MEEKGKENNGFVFLSIKLPLLFPFKSIWLSEFYRLLKNGPKIITCLGLPRSRHGTKIERLVNEMQRNVQNAMRTAKIDALQQTMSKNKRGFGDTNEPYCHSSIQINMFNLLLGKTQFVTVSGFDL